MNRKRILFYLSMIPVLALTCGACTTENTVYLESESESSEILETSEMTGQITVTTTPDTEQEPALCCVYVCGAVHTPGVYELKTGARISDAINLAGGMREDAAPASLNLAEPVTDGQMIQILTMEEAAVASQTINAAGGTELTGTRNDGVIDINTASAEQLMTLPGIGQSKADAIIAYRTEHGSFAKAEDIMNIPGIKEGVFLKIKDSISVN